MARWWQTRRFDLLELALISLAVGLGLWAFQRARLGPVGYVALRAAQEAATLKHQYGPKHYSQHYEEWVIRDFFRDRRGGFFVDVGANHYRRFSNTYYLEKTLGWSGLAVEPQVQFESDYLRHRPNTRFFPLFVSARSNESAKLYVSNRTSLVTSARKEFAARWGGATEEIEAPTITLNDLLDNEHVTGFDLLSIDIELHEPEALAGFDVARFRPRLVCIEAHPEVRQQILDFFTRHRYVVLGKYLRVDTENLYFTPLDEK